LYLVLERKYYSIY